jgi:hypothetical protein
LSQNAGETKVLVREEVGPDDEHEETGAHGEE